MTNDQLNHHAYDLVGKMKHSLKKKGADIFILNDLDILTIKWRRDESLSTMNIYQLHELMVFIEKAVHQILLEKQHIPTYKDMREIFRQDLHIADGICTGK